MLGTFEVERDRVRFRPRYPLVRGVPYRVRFDPSAVVEVGDGGGLVETELVLPDTLWHDPAIVTGVFPSGDVLPANLLKFYVHFSQPMRGWEPYDHISLIDDETGEEVRDAFHIVAEDLWDPGHQRFTVLFDPGRIKRGLRNHEAFGPPLRAGNAYRLRIASSWVDAHGHPLASTHDKVFRVGPADRESPSMHEWMLDAPVGADPLVVRFPESLDRAMLRNRLTVFDATGAVVPGDVEIGPAEREWTFRPSAAWRPGRYRLSVDPLLEDLSGNNLARVFDLDLAEGTSSDEPPLTELSFVVR